MADVEGKRKRTNAKSNFTRNINKLNKLLDNVTQAALVTPQFEKVNKCYEELEKAHDEFLTVSDIDIEVDKDGAAFMEEIDETHDAVVFRYSAFLKNDSDQQRVVERDAVEQEEIKAQENRKKIEEESRVAEEIRFAQEQKRKFDSEKTQLTLSIETFKRMTLNVKETLTDISVVDRRQEWQKVEAEYSTLKSQFLHVIGIDSTQDVTDITTSFNKDAEQVFVDTQKQILVELKDVPLTSGGTSSSSTSINNTIRREPVTLPSFEGDEKKSPFLKFPI